MYTYHRVGEDGVALKDESGAIIGIIYDQLARDALEEAGCISD